MSRSDWWPELALPTTLTHLLAFTLTPRRCRDKFTRRPLQRHHPLSDFNLPRHHLIHLCRHIRQLFRSEPYRIERPSQYKRESSSPAAGLSSGRVDVCRMCRRGSRVVCCHAEGNGSCREKGAERRLERRWCAGDVHVSREGVGEYRTNAFIRLERQYSCPSSRSTFISTARDKSCTLRLSLQHRA